MDGSAGKSTSERERAHIPGFQAGLGCRVPHPAIPTQALGWSPGVPILPLCRVPSERGAGGMNWECWEDPRAVLSIQGQECVPHVTFPLPTSETLGC